MNSCHPVGPRRLITGAHTTSRKNGIRGVIKSSLMRIIFSNYQWDMRRLSDLSYSLYPWLCGAFFMRMWDVIHRVNRLRGAMSAIRRIWSYLVSFYSCLVVCVDQFCPQRISIAGHAWFLSCATFYKYIIYFTSISICAWHRFIN